MVEVELTWFAVLIAFLGGWKLVDVIFYFINGIYNFVHKSKLRSKKDD